MNFDILNVIVSYVRPYDLASFFLNRGLDFGMKFIYDARHWLLGNADVNMMFGVFPGIIVTGICVYRYDVEPLRVSLGRLNCCIVECSRANCDGIDNFSGDWGDSVTSMILNCDQMGSLFSVLRKYRRLSSLVLNCGRGMYASMSNFPMCVNLRVLKMYEFILLNADVMALSRLVNLEEFSLEGGMGGMGGMEGRVLICEHLRAFRYVEKYKYGGGGIRGLDVLAKCYDLRVIRIYDCEDLVDVSVITKLRNLRKVDFVRCGRIGNVNVEGVRKVGFYDCGGLSNLRGLGKCRELVMSECDNFEFADGLECVRSLEMYRVNSEQVLAQCVNLRKLMVANCRLGMGILGMLGIYERLKSVWICGCDVKNLDGLNCEVLEISMCSDLMSVRVGNRVKRLEIIGCKKLKWVFAPNVCKVVISGCYFVEIKIGSVEVVVREK